MLVGLSFSNFCIIYLSNSSLSYFVSFFPSVSSLFLSLSFHHSHFLMMLLTLILLSLSCFPSEHKKIYDQFCAPFFVLAAWLTSYQGATAVESILYAGKFLSLSLVPLNLFFSLSPLSPSHVCFLPFSYFLSISTPCMYPLCLILLHYPFSPPLPLCLSHCSS